MFFPEHVTIWLLSTILAFLGSSTATKPQLVRYESRYYIIETDLPKERARFIGDVMDATGKEYDRRFASFSGKVKEKQIVRVFAKRKDYVQATADECRLSIKNAENSGGVFCNESRAVYTYDSKSLESTLKHECFHQFVRFTVRGRLPTWLNEGLAEYFEEGVYDKNQHVLKLGRAPKWRLDLLHKAKFERKLFAAGELLHLSGQDWWANMGGDRMYLQYSEAWLLCHFLVHGENGKYVGLFDKYLKLLDNGVDGGAAFRQVFGPDTKPLNDRLLEYLDRLTPRGPVN